MARAGERRRSVETFAVGGEGVAGDRGGLVGGLVGGLAVPFAFGLAAEPPGKAARGFDKGVLGVDGHGLSARPLSPSTSTMHSEDGDPESDPWH